MPPPRHRNVVIVGASAGGLAALRTLVAHLPADLEAVVLVTLHTSPTHRTTLVDLLRSVATLPVEPAREGQRLEAGRIVVAPSNQVMLIRPDRTLALVPLPPLDGRSSFDDLLVSAANVYGSSVIGVVLSGSLDLGSAGLLAVKARGGATMAQDPSEAKFPSMPSTAIKQVGVDVVASAAELGARIGRDVRGSNAIDV